MRKAAFILPVLLLLYGCSLFREVLVSRQDSLQTSSRKQSFDWSTDSLYSGSSVFTYADSTGAQFDVEIVPSGPFTFSTKAGFSGSASLLRFRGKSHTSSRAVDSGSADMQTRSSGSLKQHGKSKTQSTEKTRTKTGSNSLWWLAGSFVIGLFLIVLVKRAKRC